MVESTEWREGDPVTGECATDLSGPRTGTYVGHYGYDRRLGIHEGRAITKILDDRDGAPSFVWTGTLRPIQDTSQTGETR